MRNKSGAITSERAHFKLLELVETKIGKTLVFDERLEVVWGKRASDMLLMYHRVKKAFILHYEAGDFEQISYDTAVRKYSQREVLK